MKNFIETLKTNSNSAMDFISNEGFRLSGQEKENIIKELFWAIYSVEENNQGFGIQDEIFKEVIKNLEEYYLED